ncbi:sulfate adenylyltransferase [Candidatus Bipolaricaulota bacterium]|nr:sulfate adenylyltransferase [Candidatus Bipolaricaulota bacterium]
MIATMIAAHGGTLIDRILQGREKADWEERARDLPTIPLTDSALSELDNIACGLYSPLTGFMTSATYASVIGKMRLPTQTVWPIPIVLPIEADLAESLICGRWAALRGQDGIIYGVMQVEEIFPRETEAEAEAIYGTIDRDHPGVARIYAGPRSLVGGQIHLLTRAADPSTSDHRLDPQETRKLFQEKGWKTIVAFQTRNPIHRAHEHLQKCALEMTDGLFINPLVGETKEGDIPAAVRMDCYLAIIKGYFPAERVLLGTFPAPMRYAGPREAIFHAICRVNYGCTHIIIGRDHAGVGNYYGTYAAQEIFDRFSADEIGIIPLKFEHAFYCTKCDQMATSKTCPHGKSDRLFLSGTKVREMLQDGKDLPAVFTRPEIATILKQWALS